MSGPNVEQTEGESGAERFVLQIHLRGGQTIEKVVTEWGVMTSKVTNDLTKLTWTSADDDRLPYLRMESVDAVTVRSATEEDS